MKISVDWDYEDEYKFATLMYILVQVPFSILGIVALVIVAFIDGDIISRLPGFFILMAGDFGIFLIRQFREWWRRDDYSLRGCFYYALIGIALIIAAIFLVDAASANDYYDCPGMAIEVRDLPPVYSLTAHYPHVFTQAQAEGGTVEGIGTDTLTVTGAVLLRAETVCQWRVWLPSNHVNNYRPTYSCLAGTDQPCLEGTK